MEKVFAGIDVSKAHLDVSVRPSGELRRFSQDDGIPDLVAFVKSNSASLVVMEATGKLEVPVAAALVAAGLSMAIVNPRQARDFAKATGRLAKTDAIDAAMLAHFAEAVNPAPTPLPDEQMRELEALVARRRQLVEMVVMEKNRLLQCPA